MTGGRGQGRPRYSAEEQQFYAECGRGFLWAAGAVAGLLLLSMSQGDNTGQLIALAAMRGHMTQTEQECVACAGTVENDVAGQLLGPRASGGDNEEAPNESFAGEDPASDSLTEAAASPAGPDEGSATRLSPLQGSQAEGGPPCGAGSESCLTEPSSTGQSGGGDGKSSEVPGSASPEASLAPTDAAPVATFWQVQGESERGWLRFVADNGPQSAEGEPDPELPLLIGEACALSGVLTCDLTALLTQESRLCHWDRRGNLLKGDGGRSHGIGQIQRALWEKYWSYNPAFVDGSRPVKLRERRDNILAACSVLLHSGYDPESETARRQAFAKYNGGGSNWTCAAAQRYAANVWALSKLVAAYDPGPVEGRQAECDPASRITAATDPALPDDDVFMATDPALDDAPEVDGPFADEGAQ